MRHGIAALSILGGLALGVACAAEGTRAPEIRAGAWLNAAPLAPEDLRGKVVLVDFWTFG